MTPAMPHMGRRIISREGRRSFSAKGKRRPGRCLDSRRTDRRGFASLRRTHMARSARSTRKEPSMRMVYALGAGLVTLLILTTSAPAAPLFDYGGDSFRKGLWV